MCFDTAPDPLCIYLKKCHLTPTYALLGLASRLFITPPSCPTLPIIIMLSYSAVIPLQIKSGQWSVTSYMWQEKHFHKVMPSAQMFWVKTTIIVNTPWRPRSWALAGVVSQGITQSHSQWGPLLQWDCGHAGSIDLVQDDEHCQKKLII